ncbi:Fur family transcriptional regulator [Pseudothauera nasutitermitis]|nr:Fur family transcriptional regulator [Pseudothauera nasutitermitis]
MSVLPAGISTMRGGRIRPRATAIDERGASGRPSSRLATARETLLRAGLRVTQPRLQVLAAFLEAGQTVLSADQVMRALLDQGNDISLSSVYSALRQLDAAKLLSSRFEEGRRVYARAGALPQATVRVVCEACGTERTFHNDSLDVLLSRLVGGQGFALGDYEVLVRGVCANGCAHAAEARGPDAE